MVDNHNYSFFGQKFAIILQSSSKEQPAIFFQCIKTKSDGSWEKPSLGEGKKTKFSLEEVVMILEVLKEKRVTWSTFHKYKEESTGIVFKWLEEKDKQGDKVLQIKIGNYVKKLKWAQIKILEKLLTHVLDEKIIFATSKSTTKPKDIEINKTSPINSELKEKKEYLNDDAVSKVSGRVKGETDKALLIEFGSGVEAWIPKSRIHSIKQIDKVMKTFGIEGWVLKGKGIKV